MSGSAYDHCLDLIASGRVAVCIAGTDIDGDPCVLVPEVVDLGPVGYMAAYHPERSTRVAFVVRATVGLGMWLGREREGFTPAGTRAAQDA